MQNTKYSVCQIYHIFDWLIMFIFQKSRDLGNEKLNYKITNSKIIYIKATSHLNVILFLNYCGLISQLKFLNSSKFSNVRFFLKFCMIFFKCICTTVSQSEQGTHKTVPWKKILASMNFYENVIFNNFLKCHFSNTKTNKEIP